MSWRNTCLRSYRDTQYCRPAGCTERRMTARFNRGRYWRGLDEPATFGGIDHPMAHRTDGECSYFLAIAVADSSGSGYVGDHALLAKCLTLLETTTRWLVHTRWADLGISYYLNLHHDDTVSIFVDGRISTPHSNQSALSG